MKTLDEHILEHHKSSALYTYRRPINQFLACVGEETAKNATYGQIIDYINLLRKGKISAATAINHLFAIKMYYQWLVETGQRDDHPCRDFYIRERRDRSIKTERLYTKQEMEEIVNSFVSRDALNRNRDKIVLSLLVNQALTVYEIRNLKIGDIDLQAGQITVRECNTAKPRTLPLNSEQIMLFNDYITHCRPLFLRKNKKATADDCQTLILSRQGNKLAPNILTGIFKNKLSNGMKITPQRVRQSAIALKLKEGADLRVLQAFTGHNRLSSVEAYKQTGLEELKNLITKYHPLQ